ncbi:MAG: T9SS type A sorting domain-containing protein [Bacteroidales bacterium]|nr:T9SS type A sorting domain-containing protein [Bacteroidales bacterium]
MKNLVILLALSFTTVCSRQLSAQVLIEDSGNFIRLSNSEVSLAVDKSSARIIELRLRDQSLLAPGQSGYFTMIAADINAAGQTLPITNCSFRIHIESEQTVDLAFVPEPSPGFPFDTELHYVLRDGEPGFYFYLVAGKSSGTPDARIDQLRFAMRVDHSMLNIRLSDNRSGTICSTEEILNAQGMVMDATYMLESGEYRTKYEWSSPTEEARVYGLNNGTQGIWMIRGGNEYLNGGPTKQHNTCHGTDKGPILLNLLYSTHYGSSGSYVSGEWNKVFGPTFVYLNCAATAGSLWEDARKEGEKHRNAWPYPWMDLPGYPVRRATVSGRFSIADTGWALLARPKELRGLDWQQQGGDSYIYRARIQKDGSFAIPAVRKGTYTLYAFAPGIVGEFRKDAIVVDTATEISLGDLTWLPRSFGNVLWRIGVPDRTAAEFRHGNDYRHWGLWFQYPYDFPDDVLFLPGYWEERNDWNYAHMAMWDEEGGWAPKLDASLGDGKWVEPVWTILFNCAKVPEDTATLTLALAGVSRDAGLTVTLNGNPLGSIEGLTGDGCVHRNGIYGFFRERFIRFDAALLNEGENVIGLELKIDQLPKTRTNYSFGIMYDFLQLEVKENTANLPAENESPLLTIYPNPASDILHIQLPENSSAGVLRVVNMSGQTVYSGMIDHTMNRIPVHYLPSGIYTAILETEEALSRNKFVVK